MRPFIQSYLVIDNEAGSLNRVLPDTTLAMAFRYKGMVQAHETAGALPAVILSGLRKSARQFRYGIGSGNIIVRFRPTGAAAFLSTPLHELFGESLSLDHFFSREAVNTIEERLAEAGSHADRIALLDQFLLSRLRPAKPDQLVIAAIQKLQAARGSYNIKSLAQELFISQDAFEKRFRRLAGATPKQFASLVRMKQIVAAGRSGESLTGLAYDAGYYDQAHFNKQFKLFTGQTPTAFYRTPPLW